MSGDKVLVPVVSHRVATSPGISIGTQGPTPGNTPGDQKVGTVLVLRWLTGFFTDTVTNLQFVGSPCS